MVVRPIPRLNTVDGDILGGLSANDGQQQVRRYQCMQQLADITEVEMASQARARKHITGGEIVQLSCHIFYCVHSARLSHTISGSDAHLMNTPLSTHLVSESKLQVVDCAQVFEQTTLAFEAGVRAWNVHYRSAAILSRTR